MLFRSDLPEANMRFEAPACSHWIHNGRDGKWNLNQISCGNGDWYHDCMKNGPYVAALQLRIPEGIKVSTYSAGGEWRMMFDDLWWRFHYSIDGPNGQINLHPQTMQIAGFHLEVMDGWYCPS